MQTAPWYRHRLLLAIVAVAILIGMVHLLDHVAHCGDQSGNCHLCQIATALFPAVAAVLLGLLVAVAYRLHVRETICDYGFDPRTLSSRAPPLS